MDAIIERYLLHNYNTNFKWLKIMKKIFTNFLILFTLFACQTEKDRPLSKEEKINLQIQVPLSRLPLFANLSDYLVQSSALETKSTLGTTTLESLLNLDSIKTSHWKSGITYTQIPFLQNEEFGAVAILTSDMESFSNEGTIVKKYLIYKDSSKKRYPFVVTLIAESQYYKYHEDFDFLNRPNFSGVALFSNLEGDILMMRSYKNGLICPAKALKTTENNIEADSTRNVGFVVFRDNQVLTKQNEVNWITASYCFAFKYYY